ncbi:MAG: hypothetical protein ACPGRX_08620 [Bdellovibrionales bacterium]
MAEKSTDLILEQIKLLRDDNQRIRGDIALFKRDVMSRMEVLSNRVFNKTRLFGDYMAEIATLRYDLGDLRTTVNEIGKKLDTLIAAEA